MAERGSRLASWTKRRLRSGFASLVGRQQFQRNEAVQTGVAGFVNNAHTALAELRVDPVMAECLADSRVSHCLNSVLRVLPARKEPRQHS